MATYPVNAFATFLPYPVLKPSLGQPWYIVESMIEKNGMCIYVIIILPHKLMFNTPGIDGVN